MSIDSVNNSKGSEPKYSSISIRFLAAIIDGILLTIIAAPLFHLANIKSVIVTRQDYLDNPHILYGLIAKLLSVIGIEFLFVMLLTIPFWLYYGATPGKMLFRIKIVSGKDFGKLTLSQCVKRYFGYIVSTLPLAIGFAWADFDKKRRQTFHDKIAGTVVVKASSIANLNKKN